MGMNDTTEISYTDNYIFGESKIDLNTHWKKIESIDSRFISSCSALEDDLTQWRLYGDDGKGVMLKFKVIRDKDVTSNLILKKVNYSNKNAHPALDFLKDIIENLENLDIKYNFKALSTWKNFFKPYDYRLEEEIRLLFILTGADDRRKWDLTKDYNIFNPFVEFVLNTTLLPMKLVGVTLGPNCPNQLLNYHQINQFRREYEYKTNYDIKDFEVSISTIRNYR
jgi:hypothetical protein